ncbi:PEP-CTERM/exosortase system-associated acyltransferase [Halomonas sp. I5-271120]|uniref:PEP-CTERM/exosortase system-associated acyltransferase n=1 Tax=Halomonas sp. I5-271120 TaxID=3061632 RepID=UPI00271517A2|nr:PEP-CTERM/exosortase system-associated acyltransferase [Halomonas sp. I5-271120]
METKEKLETSKKKYTARRNAYLFDKYFQVNIASTQKEEENLRRLRHEIFIEELEYKLNADKDKQFEYDRFDNSSIHCFITHKRTGMIAGCMRLVKPVKGDSDNLSLPLEDVCTPLFNHPNSHPRNFPNNEVCEVSRFAIPKIFRKNKNQETESSKNFKFQDEESELFPIIMISLFLATFALVGLTGRPHVFALMQPNLPRALSFSGFYFTRVTDIFEYFGTRGAFYINYESAKNEFKKELNPLYLHIRNQIKEKLPAEHISVSQKL